MRDIRDQRDPTALGNAIKRLHSTGRFKKRSITDAADAVEHARRIPGALSLPDYAEDIPNYAPAESSVQSTVRTRQQELRDRASRGDRYAISMLTTGEPGDSAE